MIPGTTRTLLLLAASTAVACAMPAGAEGADPAAEAEASQAITNGETTHHDPAVVALLRGGRAYCSGVVIRRWTVLTAGHCAMAGAEPDEVFFGDDTSGPGLRVPVLMVRRHPTFVTGSPPVDDLALLLLEREAPVEPIPWMPWALSERDVGEPIWIVGFGATDAAADAATRTSAVKRGALTTLGAMTDWTFTMSSSPGQACVGDSGGPSLMTLDGRDYVVGIHSFGDETCSHFAVDTRVDAYAASFVEPSGAELELLISPHMMVSTCSVAAMRRGGGRVAWALVVLCALAAVARRRRRSPRGLALRMPARKGSAAGPRARTSARAPSPS